MGPEKVIEDVLAQVSPKTRYFTRKLSDSYCCRKKLATPELKEAVWAGLQEHMEAYNGVVTPLDVAKANASIAGVSGGRVKVKDDEQVQWFRFTDPVAGAN